MDEDEWHPPVLVVVKQEDDKISPRVKLPMMDFDEDEDDWHPPQQSEEMRQRSEVINDDEEEDIVRPQVKQLDLVADEDDWHPSQKSEEIPQQSEVTDEDKIADIVVDEHAEQTSEHQPPVSMEENDDTALLQQVSQLSLGIDDDDEEEEDQCEEEKGSDDEDEYDDDDDSNMSDISDHFEGDAHLLDVNMGRPITVGIQAPVLSLDEVSYSRDLKSINKPAEAHAKLLRNGNRGSSSRLLEVDGGRGSGRMDDRGDGSRRDRRRGRRDGNLSTVVISASDQLVESGASRGPGKLVVFDDDPKPSQRRRRVREPRGDRGVDAPLSRRERGGNEAAAAGGGSSHGESDRRRGGGGGGSSSHGRSGRSRNGGGGGGGVGAVMVVEVVVSEVVAVAESSIDRRGGQGVVEGWGRTDVIAGVLSLG